MTEEEAWDIPAGRTLTRQPHRIKRRNTCGGDSLKRLGKNLAAVCMPAVTAMMFAYVVTCFLTGDGTADGARQKTGTEAYGVQTGEASGELTESEYICGHLAAALPPEADEEAMKALAVVLRTQLYRLAEEQAANRIQIEPSAYLEEYVCAKAWGVDRYILFREKAKRVINETAAQVLRDENGALIEAPYHGVSAGRTRSGSDAYPYLQPAESKSDVEAAQYLTVYWFEERQLHDCFPDISEKEWAQIMAVEETDSFYIKEVCVGEQTIDGETFREKLSLCSSAYFTSWKENGLQVICRGQGHGFGMSCYGAQQMAADGSGYEEILSHYYKAVNLEENE